MGFFSSIKSFGKNLFSASMKYQGIETIEQKMSDYLDDRFVHELQEKQEDTRNEFDRIEKEYAESMGYAVKVFRHYVDVKVYRRSGGKNETLYPYAVVYSTDDDPREKELLSAIEDFKGNTSDMYENSGYSVEQVDDEGQELEKVETGF